MTVRGHDTRHRVTARFGLEAPLIERERDLASLAGVLDSAGAGAGRIAWVEGSAGTGKTRLLAEVLELAEARGMSSLAARGAELERGSPFGLARRLLEPRLAGLDPETRAELFGGAAAPAAELLQGVPAVGPPPADVLLAIANGFYLVCSRLAERGPVLLTADDLHWADAPSLSALAYLAARVDELAIAVVLAARTGEQLAGPDPTQAIGESSAFTSVSLRELTEPASGRLLEALLGGVDPSFTAAAHRSTGGNPFLLRELALTAAREEIEPDRDGAAWVERAVPGSVRGWALRRLARLPDSAQEVARSLAVLESADLRLAGAHADLVDAASAGACDLLASAGLTEAELPLRFAHPLVRAAVYESLPPAARDDGHHRAALLLHERGARPDAVAAHLLESGPREQGWAVAALRSAGAEALRRGAPDRAVRLLQRARDEGAGSWDAEMEFELGTAMFAAGEPEALDCLERAADEAPSPLARARALGALAQARYIGGQPVGAIAAVRSGLEAIPPGQGEVVEAELLATLGLAGRPIPGLVDELDELLARPRPTPEGQPSLAEIVRRQLRSLDALMRGDRSVAVTEVRRAAPSLIDEEISGELAIVVCASPAFVLAGLGEHDAAAPLLERLLERTQRRGSRLETAEVLEARAWSRWRRGHVHGTLADTELLLSLSEGWWPVGKVPALVARAAMLAERDEVEQAREVLAQPAEIMEQLPGTWGWIWLPYGHARVELAAQDWSRALREALVCGERANEVKASSPEYLEWRALAARAAARLGETERGAELAGEQLARGREIDSPRAIGYGLAALGAVTGGAEGAEHLAEAATQLTAAGDELAVADALVERGMLLRRARRPRDAREPLRQALDAAHRLGSTRLVRIARSELLAAGGRPRRERATGADALTSREREVAELAASGLSNPDIADRLFVTRKTVEGHLRTVFRKLDVGAREELAGALASKS